MIVSCCLCSAPFTTSANTFNNAYAINLDEPYSAALSASSSDMTKLWTVFKCTASGYYEVVCTSAEAADNTVYLGVYDEDKALIDYKVNTDLSISFSAVTYFESGYKYYYYLTTDSDSYSFDLALSTHTHSYSVSQRIKAVADDDEGARTDGYERMVCEACKQYYDTAVYYAPSSAVLSKTLYTASGTEKSRPSPFMTEQAILFRQASTLSHTRIILQPVKRLPLSHLIPILMTASLPLRLLLNRKSRALSLSPQRARDLK